MIENKLFEKADILYGFNGQEKDDEVKGSGNSYEFDARFYDPRLGKWLSIDPLAKKFPSWSPFVFVMNDPMVLVDKNGKDIYYFDEFGNLEMIQPAKGPDVFYQQDENKTELIKIEGGFIEVSSYQQVDGSRFIPQLYAYHNANGTLNDFTNKLFNTGMAALGYEFANYAGQKIIEEGHQKFMDNGGLYFILFVTCFPVLPILLENPEALAIIVEAMEEEAIDQVIYEITGEDLPFSPVDLAKGMAKKGLKKEIKDVVENDVTKAIKSNRKGKNKLKADETAAGSHSTFSRDDNGNIYKYETYEKTKTGYFNPRKRFDGGKPNGESGASHGGLETPHVTGKSVEGRFPNGVRKPTKSEYPNNSRFNKE